MSLVSDPLLEKERASFSSDMITLDNDEENLSIHLSSIQRSWTTHRIALLLLRVCVTVLALWGVLASIMMVLFYRRQTFLPSRQDVYHPATLPSDANSCDCGTTLESALAKGCKYDSLAAAWLPASCRDDELTARFEKAGSEPDGSWPYWADGEGKQRIDLDEVAALGPQGGLFWTTREWHMAHCMFYWQKLYRMRDTGAIMEKRYDSEHHVKHCGRLAMRERPTEFFLVDVPVQMNSAVSLDPKKLPGMHHMLGQEQEEQT